MQNCKFVVRTVVCVGAKEQPRVERSNLACPARLYFMLINSNP